jgi:phosphomannomutase
MDGAKCLRDDGAWLLFRLSGTEPLVRVYAEAMSEEDRRGMLEEGRNLIVGAAGG